jgi:ATP-binding cassette, subfamily B (MDR/TAP), member 1
MGKEEADHSKGGDDQGDEKVPFYKLFSFADALDVVLMSVGTVAAIGSGLSLPLMTLIFGQMINSFGDSNRDNVVHDVTKV